MIRRPCARVGEPLPYPKGPPGATRNGDPWLAPGFTSQVRILTGTKPLHHDTVASPRRRRFFVESGCTARKRNCPVSGSYLSSPSLYQFLSQSEERNRRHILEKMVLHLLDTHQKCRRPSHCRMEASADFLPISIPSSLLQRPNLCLVICTTPRLQISTDTFAACAIPSKGSVNVASLSM